MDHIRREAEQQQDHSPDIIVVEEEEEAGQSEQRKPLSLAELNGDPRRIDACANGADHRLGEGARENVIVLDVRLVGLQPLVTALSRARIGLLKQEELEFTPRVRV